jgi:hypothetical protein
VHTPSKQQAEFLRNPPNTVDCQRMNGNRIRTFKSCLDAGWIEWDSRGHYYAVTRLTEAGKQALERYRAKARA